MKLWDFRIKAPAKLTMYGKAEIVRDAKWNPKRTHEFIAAFENGCIQKWDIRNPNDSEKVWNAHNGIVLGIDWHADGVLLCSGGRDKMIKVWDTRSDDKTPIGFINTTAPVSRLRWRPGHSSQVASCSLSVDSRILIWDLARPHVPKLCLDQHKSDTTGILWFNQNIMWSCSKDGTFMQHDIADGFMPESLLSYTSINWDAWGNMAVAIPNQLVNVEPISPLPQPILSPAALQSTAVLLTDTFDYIAFLEFAQKCMLDSDDVEKSCLHNAEVSMSNTSYVQILGCLNRDIFGALFSACLKQ